MGEHQTGRHRGRGLFWVRRPLSPRAWREDWRERQAWKGTVFRDERFLFPGVERRGESQLAGAATVIGSSPYVWLVPLVPGLVLWALFLAVLLIPFGGEADALSDPVSAVLFAGVAFAMFLVNALWWLLGAAANAYTLTATSLVSSTRWRRITVDWSSIDALTLVGGPMSWRATFVDRAELPRLRAWSGGRSRTLPPVLLWRARAFYEAERDLRAACIAHSVSLRREDI